ncbi:MAG: ribonuclease [Deltaproteobacteria bacterium RIFCSPLOWO2_02_56_12]|nr:MAG: ribonuclease [Deltaproteobacteria bacterium RBG_16_55_12]OGQ56152.1 MAG: ribonuclease [Deltaproteobacteria bacterium RIFCSPLOWO2_02_56_12]OGQ71418.1 MAG: ribonuclease [Deltaproteobacteria bacterium RIFCSPLOWO2_12_55_13]OGQ91176.1 MAG: ribonuclease [Deltaproteobacteria bacterium RIFOXYA2_FULL_55_11]
MILVDTSVWVQHLRSGSERLRSLLDEEQVFCHPFVIGELACGTLRNRQEVLSLLKALPQARGAEHEEVLHLLEGRHLYGRGLGWVDVHLLASALLTACSLWTLDKPLRRAATALNIAV